MGDFSSRNLPKAMREKLGITLQGGKARTALGTPIVGATWFRFDGDPPTTTHHDKELVVRGGKPQMRNSKALEAAWHYYLRQLPGRAQPLMPIAGPVHAEIIFRYRMPQSSDHDAGDWHQEKPDFENACKVLLDALSLKGYLVDDKHVVRAWVEKLYGGRLSTGVHVLLRTITPHDPPHPELMAKLTPRLVYREITPLPWVIAAEAKAATTAKAAPLGTPGGRRKPDNPTRNGARAKAVVLPASQPASDEQGLSRGSGSTRVETRQNRSQRLSGSQGEG